MKLFIDDERYPIDESWCIVRSSDEAISWLRDNGIPEYISFDHDLGDSDTSMIIIHWIVEQVLDEKLKFPDNFEYYVHSQNPIGKKNIEGLLDNFIDNIRI